MLKIGIPVLNRGDLLTRLVESIDVAAEVRIVVNRIGPVDGSVAAAVRALEERPPGHLRVAVERVDGNLGVSGSWNRIIEGFGGDCWIANSDIAFAPGVLGEAMAQVAAEREIVLHHLWAAACFFVTAEFTRTLGWFDENFTRPTARIRRWRCAVRGSGCGGGISPASARSGCGTAGARR